MNRIALVAFLVVAFGAGALSERRLRREISAAGMLLRLSAPAPKPAALAAGRPRTEDLVVGEGSAASHVRLYFPEGPVLRCAVVGHGVHYKAIEEPRLVRFATELARASVLVMTPELRDLADYRITRSGADVLAAAVKDLARRCRGPVGLVGFSFAGGLSLLAATEPDVNRHLAYVASVGGYDDLPRVQRFLLTDRVETLSGTVPRAAHEYGLVVLLYGHLDTLAPPEDLDVLREAYRAWLHEDRAAAWAIASRRSTQAGEDLFIRLASGHVAEYRPELAAELAEDEAAGRLLSPDSRLQSIPVPTLLLHGTGDSVIPPEETLFAARELGSHAHRALVTPLIEHVELSRVPKVGDAVALVDFMAALL